MSILLPEHSYPMVRLGAVAAVQSGLTLDSGRTLDASSLTLPYLRVANVQDGWIDLSEVKEVNVSWALARRCELKPGDVLMTEGGDPDKLGRGTVWRGEIPGCLHQNHIFAVRPTKVLAPRYLALLTQTSYARAYFEATASKTTGIASTSVSKISSFRIPLPPIEQQNHLVDFLDVETARIDALVAKKRRLTELLSERRAGFVEQEIRNLAEQYGELRLKVATADVIVGIVVTPAKWYQENGIPALRGLNVKPGRISGDDLVFLSAEGDRINRKSKLRTGDVVVVRTGQAGAAAVVTPEFDGANCIDLLIIKPGRLNPEYLTFVLNSDWTQKHIRQHSVGTIQAHFNVGTMAELPLPVPPKEVQQVIVGRLSQRTEIVDEVHCRLNHQISLLQEHRQALITAAVTGDLGIPKQAGVVA